jgi:hypothetical protein
VCGERVREDDGGPGFTFGLVDERFESSGRAGQIMNDCH